MTDRSTFFWSKVLVRSDGCWEWIGAKTRGGPSITGRYKGPRCRYASMRIPDPTRASGSKTIRVHRWAYTRFRPKSPFPQSKDLDHTCNFSLCVNPYHLKPVTKSKNTKLQHARRRAHQQSQP